MDVRDLVREWAEAKQQEVVAREKRRAIEDQIIAAIGGVPPQAEGTKRIAVEDWEIKIVAKLERKVDAELLQKIAEQHGLTEQLRQLFRWTPEVNLSAWREADETITFLLSPAITVKPCRPSVSIVYKGDEK